MTLRIDKCRSCVYTTEVDETGRCEGCRIREVERDISGRIERGFYDPDCVECQRQIDYYREHWTRQTAPLHNALSSCRSGGRNHCTCDSCF